jgi:hypothetical protein
MTVGSWNHRVMKHANGDERPIYQVHEAFYDDDGNLKSWTAEPVCVTTDSVPDILTVLSMMAGAVDRPVLDNR